MFDENELKESINYYDVVLIRVRPSKMEFFKIDETARKLIDNDIFNEKLLKTIKRKHKNKFSRSKMVLVTDRYGDTQVSVEKRKEILKATIEARDL